MLSENEYNDLLPYRDKLIDFQKTGRGNAKALPIINKIRQSRGWGVLNYSCGGCVANAQLDAIALITEYEDQIKKNVK